MQCGAERGVAVRLVRRVCDLTLRVSKEVAYESCGTQTLCAEVTLPGVDGMNDPSIAVSLPPYLPLGDLTEARNL